MNLYKLYMACYDKLEGFKLQYWSIYFINLFSSILVLIEPYFLQKLIMNLQNYNSQKSVFYLTGILFLHLSIIIINYFNSRRNIFISKSVTVKVKNNLLYNIMKVHPDVLRKYTDGKLINIYMEDTFAIYNFISFISSYFVDILICIILCICIWSSSKLLFILALVNIPFRIAINYLSKKNISSLNLDVFNYSDKFMNQIKKIIQYKEDQYINNLFEKIYIHYLELINIVKNKIIDRDNFFLKIKNMNDFVDYVGYFSCLLGACFLILNKEINIAELITLLSYTKLLNKSVLKLTSIITDIQQVKLKIERVFELEQTCVRAIEYEKKKSSIIGKQYKIKLLDLDLVKNNHTIFNHVSIDFQSRYIYKISGSNGSGKSSLMKLISGLYHPTRGKIQFDGVSSMDISDEWFKENISYVNDNIIIYHLSIYENITLSDDLNNIDMERVIEVCKCVDIYEDILVLPQTFNTIIDDNFKLSSGQKRKIQLARCLLRNKPIILLDEPWTYLDNKSKKSISDYIFNKLEFKILVLIDHHIDSYNQYDYNYHIKDNQIYIN